MVMIPRSFPIYIVLSLILLSFCSIISAVPEPQVDVLIRLEGSVFFSESDADDNYVVSDYLPETVMGLVHAEGYFKDVSSGSNSMSLRNAIGSKTYLVYTEGDRDDIENKIDSIHSGEFEKMPNPSFGFPIYEKNTVVIELGYENTDVISKEIFGAGFHDLIIENGGTDGNRFILGIMRK